MKVPLCSAQDMDVFVKVPSTLSIVSLLSGRIIRSVDIKDWSPGHYKFGSHRRHVPFFKKCFACGHEWPMIEGLGVAWATSKGLAKWTQKHLYCKPCFAYPLLNEVALWKVECEYVEVPVKRVEEHNSASSVIAETVPPTILCEPQQSIQFHNPHAFLHECEPTDPLQPMQANYLHGIHARSASSLGTDSLSSQVQYSYIGSSSTPSDNDALPPPPLRPGFRQAQVGERFCLRDDICGLLAGCYIAIIPTDLCMVAGSFGVLLRNGHSAAVVVLNRRDLDAQHHRVVTPQETPRPSWTRTAAGWTPNAMLLELMCPTNPVATADH